MLRYLIKKSMAKVYFYYSAMNAGKSTTLLQANYNYQERGMQTLLFSPTIDTRHPNQHIHSRIGLEAPAIGADAQFDFYTYAKEQKKKMPKLTCLLVDEAQFIKKEQVKQLMRISSELHIPILTYGLRTDFQGEPFEGSMYLLAWAEEIIEIKTVCSCGSKAIMNMRIDKQGNPVREGEQVHVGGEESYISMCMKHFAQKTQFFTPNKVLT